MYPLTSYNLIEMTVLPTDVSLLALVKNVWSSTIFYTNSHSNDCQFVNVVCPMNCHINLQIDDV